MLCRWDQPPSRAAGRSSFLGQDCDPCRKSWAPSPSWLPPWAHLLPPAVLGWNCPALSLFCIGRQLWGREGRAEKPVRLVQVPAPGPERPHDWPRDTLCPKGTT